MESEDLCNSVDEIDTRLGDIIETSYERGLVWVVMKVENIRDSLGVFIRS